MTEMENSRDLTIANLLSAIEIRELQLINRGAVHASISEAELDLVLSEALIDSNLEPRGVNEYVDELIRKGLIFRCPSGGFRSRMAETVRNLALLRQTFSSRHWSQSPELMIDFKILHKPRRRPSRKWHRDLLLDAALAGTEKSMRTSLVAITPEAVSAFQIDSSRAINLALQSDFDRGVVVSAGTGSGKTLAFYIPAIAWILDSIRESDDHWVRALAIYPRNELLKDQLRTALGLSWAMTSADDREIRPLRIGAWFGAVPESPQMVKTNSSWKVFGTRSNPSGYKCPYFDCPNGHGELVWLIEDIDGATERLICVDESCEIEIDGDRVALTRQSSRKKPVDILFTTCESMNRQLSSPANHWAFGLAGRKRLRMILLDEVHTYEGSSGAQSAYLMRRIRAAVGRGPVAWVGLSATLVRAQEYFSNFVNLRIEDVAVAEANPDEMEESGAEYQLVLRHNPASKTSPLSATIQTTFALQRSLDRSPSQFQDPFGSTPVSSDGIFGSRTFVFTDKLDVTNRLYWQLNDAEGWWDENHPKRNRVPTTLAHLRSTSQNRIKEGYRDDTADRDFVGQWWWMSEHLGHPIDQDLPIKIGRTSSQDQGVSDADVIVATASLEVGYDDDSVGAVIQHRAPQNAARFIQRKGRAGRKSNMRPWTVLIVSDWGRDRLAWQAHEQVLDPEIEANRLPMRNRYIQKMQCVYSTMDWLARENRNDLPDRNTWADLAGPADLLHQTDQQKRDRRLERQSVNALILAEVLEGGPARSRLLSHLNRSLDIPHTDLERLLWLPPRALMLAVIPTAMRRLSTQWLGERPRMDDQRVSRRNPLPEFVAGNLFEDLLTPEVSIFLPAIPNEKERRQNSLPVVRVLREYMPGNISRHFGVHTMDRRHWVPIGNTSDGKSFCDIDRYQAKFVREISIDGRNLEIYRPTEFELETPPEEMTDSSSTSPVWNAYLEPLGAGLDLELAPKWGEAYSNINFYLHSHGDGVRVTRYIERVVGSTRSPSGSEPVQVYFCRGSNKEVHAALGVEIESDGVSFCSNISISERPVSAEERSLRLLDLVTNAERLASVPFLNKSAMVTALLLMIAREGLEPLIQMNFRDFSDAISSSLWDLGYSKWDPQEVGDEVDPESEQDCLVDLDGIVRSQTTLVILKEALSAVRSEEGKDWIEWRSHRAVWALADNFITAGAQLVNTFDPNQIAVDVVIDDVIDQAIVSATVWITEVTPGGNGIVESLLEECRKSPLEFRQLLFAGNDESDLETLDREMQWIIREDDQLLSVAIDELASSWDTGHESVGIALDAIQQRSIELRPPLGISRTASSFLANRLCAPGSSGKVRELISEILTVWKSLELDRNFLFDSRIVGVLFSGDLTVDATTMREFSSNTERSKFVANLFWPSGLDLLSSNDGRYQVFGPTPTLDRNYLRENIQAPWRTVEFGTHEQAAIDMELEFLKLGAITFRVADAEEAASLIGYFLAKPIEVDSLFIYPRVSGLSAHDGYVDVSFSSSETAI